MSSRLSIHRSVVLLIVLMLLAISVSSAGAASTEPNFPKPLQNNPDGIAIANETMVSTILTPVDPDRFNPNSAADIERGRFMVVWHQKYSTGQPREVYGQIVLENGTNYGPPIVIASGSHGYVNPSVAFSKTSHLYMVVYMSDVNGDGTKYDIEGRCYNPDGSVVGPPFLVATWANRSFWTPRIGWNSMWDEFMVIFGAFTTDNPPIANNIGMKALDSLGNELWSWSWGSPSEVPTNPDIAYDQDNDRYLVVWNELNASGNNIIRGSLRSSEGNEIWPVDIFGSTTNDSLFPRVGSSIPAFGLTYMVTFEYVYSSDDHDIYYAYVSYDGTIVVPGYVDTTIANDTDPDVAGSPDQFGYVVTYQRADPNGSKILNWGLWGTDKKVSICNYFSTNCLMPAVDYGNKTFMNTYIIENPTNGSATGQVPNLAVVQHVFDRPVNTAAVFLPIVRR